MILMFEGITAAQLKNLRRLEKQLLCMTRMPSSHFKADPTLRQSLISFTAFKKGKVNHVCINLAEVYWVPYTKTILNELKGFTGRETHGWLELWTPIQVMIEIFQCLDKYFANAENQRATNDTYWQTLLNGSSFE